jgi:hypothetical protein
MPWLIFVRNGMILVVPDGDWPVAKRADDLVLSEMFSVLDQFEDYWPAALDSLAGTPDNRSNGA